MKKRQRKRILRNKKGITYIEAIAVVAIMGVLATVIGSLLTSATTSYMRQKESAASKDLSLIVTKELSRHLKKITEAYLQDEDGLPDGTFNLGDVSYEMTLASTPFKEYNGKTSYFYVSNGILMYSYYDNENNKRVEEDYFGNAKAFYGKFTIDVKYEPIIDEYGYCKSLKLYVDVFLEGKEKYKSPGTTVLLQESTVSTNNLVKSAKDDISPTSIRIFENESTEYNCYGEYLNTLSSTTKYTRIYFLSR